MKGFVDDQLRALLRVPVSASRDGTRRDLVVWIDTAFNGGLAIPRKQIAELGLVQESSADAVLLANNGLFLTANRRDFEKVNHLQTQLLVVRDEYTR